jgi:hypothetical protein
MKIQLTKIFGNNKGLRGEFVIMTAYIKTQRRMSLMAHLKILKNKNKQNLKLLDRKKYKDQRRN